MLTLLERLAEAGPVVMVIEDAHWADRSTRDLMAFLIRNQQALDGVLIVVSYRSDELHRTHPLRPLLAELTGSAGSTRMELRRLCPLPDTTSWWPASSAGSPSRGSDRYTGAPRATRCSSRSCCQRRRAGTGLPESLRDLLLAGVQRLPDETQELVRVASAGGERSSHALLAAVTGLDGDDLARGLRPAVAANVLRAGRGRICVPARAHREAITTICCPASAPGCTPASPRSSRLRCRAGRPGPGPDRAGASLVTRTTRAGR